MSSNNWEKIGEEIRKTVQDAVTNHNYDRLNHVISDTIEQAVDTVANGVKNAANSSQTKYRGYKTYTTDFEQAKQHGSGQGNVSGMQYSNIRKETKPVPIKIATKAPSKIGTMTITILGYAFGGLQFLLAVGGLVAILVADVTLGVGVKVLAGITGILLFALFVLCFGVGVAGTRKISRLERFKAYLEALGGREYCNISELAARVGKSSKSVKKDLEYMISERWFLQGHLDKQKTCLIATERMYAQYCQLEQRKVIEQKEAKEREELIASRKMLSPEVQNVIEKGDEYIKKIRACNEAIHGKKISEKIYHIEMLVDKIFDRVEQNPKCVSDVRKLMEYYLPTTVKLLEAYVEMDSQPTDGENIRAAKSEIEATLDTLNIAFEKLLDSLFQETAWDVSSDISVLNMMLTREGLKEDGLKIK